MLRLIDSAGLSKFIVSAASEGNSDDKGCTYT